jgi:hypothetical protein
MQYQPTLPLHQLHRTSKESVNFQINIILFFSRRIWICRSLWLIKSKNHVLELEYFCSRMTSRRQILWTLVATTSRCILKLLFINMLRRQLLFAAFFLMMDCRSWVHMCALACCAFRSVRKICKSTDALLSAARAKGGFRRRHHPFVPGAAAEAFKKLSEWVRADF